MEARERKVFSGRQARKFSCKEDVVNVGDLLSPSEPEPEFLVEVILTEGGTAATWRVLSFRMDVRESESS